MATFTGSDELPGSEFVDADLHGARFVRADLSGVVMRAVDVQGADIDAPFLFAVSYTHLTLPTILLV